MIIGKYGTLYKIPKIKTSVNDGKHYIIKVFKYDKSTLPQIKKELRILKKLESNDAVMEIINPCIDTIITKSYIITILLIILNITIICLNPQMHLSD